MNKIVFMGGVSDLENIQGGIQSVVSSLIMELSNNKNYLFYLVGHNIKTHKYNNINFYNLSLPVPKLGIALNYLFFSKKIIKIIEQNINPHIYHFQGTIPNIFLLNKNIAKKSVFTQHAILKEEIKYQANLIRKLKFFLKIITENLLIKNVKNIIFISDYNRSVTLSNFKFSNNLKEIKIFNPVNRLYFFEQPNITPKFDHLYFVGEIKKRKGIHDLLIAMSNLKKEGILYYLNIIGDFKENTYKDFIFKLIEDNKLKEQVIFWGWRKPADIVNIANNCAVFALPSYQETLPVSIAEAMALGKIILATNLPGVLEMLGEPDNALLFEKGNLISLTNILKNLYIKPKMFNSLGIAVRKVAQNSFYPSEIAAKTEKFYESILNSPIS